MALIKCSECGADISEKASVCPKCGCPAVISKEIILNQKKEKTKNIMKGVIVFAVLAIIVITVFILISRPNTDGYYKDTRWGMSIAQVKKEMGDGAIIDEDAVLNTIEDYDGKAGIKALISCDCTDDSLQKVTLYLTYDDDSSYTDSDLMNEYKESFDKLYGKSEEADGIITWDTSKSRIELYFINKLVFITYENITKIEED